MAHPNCQGWARATREIVSVMRCSSHDALARYPQLFHPAMSMRVFNLFLAFLCGVFVRLSCVRLASCPDFA